MTGPNWCGEWVAERLGVRLTDEPSPVVSLAQLAGLAVRRNPRRAHLIVSTVLGKHIPVDPALAVGAGRLLGLRVAQALGADVPVETGLQALAAMLAGRPADHAALSAPPVVLAQPPVVVGYAETATSLGHLVADAFAGAGYLHSTRRRPPGLVPYAEFDEAHSHATEHLLYPAETGWLHRDAPLVLVDDELTTGRTAAQTIRALHAARPRAAYVIASLVDLRTAADRARLDALGDELGASVRVVALAAGEVVLPRDVLTAGAALVEQFDRPDALLAQPPAPVHRVPADWPGWLPAGGRHGFLPEHRAAFDTAIGDLAAEVRTGLPERGPVLVLGTEEFMYAPLRLAAELGGEMQRPVHFSSTTRSPVLAVDDAGYAVRTRLSFPAPEGEPTEHRFAYNVTGFDHVVLMVDDGADTVALWRSPGLVSGLRRVCAGITVVTVPDRAGTPALAVAGVAR